MGQARPLGRHEAIDRHHQQWPEQRRCKTVKPAVDEPVDNERQYPDASEQQTGGVKQEPADGQQSIIHEHMAGRYPDPQCYNRVPRTRTGPVEADQEQEGKPRANGNGHATVGEQEQHQSKGEPLI